MALRSVDDVELMIGDDGRCEDSILLSRQSWGYFALEEWLIHQRCEDSKLYSQSRENVNVEDLQVKGACVARTSKKILYLLTCSTTGVISNQSVIQMECYPTELSYI